jgi:hypothetical protein
VRYRGQELTLLGELPFDAFCHVVDGIGKNTELTASWAPQLNAALQIPRSDFASDRDQ